MTEKRKLTANDAADCINMMHPRHGTVHHNAQHRGIVHLLNRSTIDSVVLRLKYSDSAGL